MSDLDGCLLLCAKTSYSYKGLCLNFFFSRLWILTLWTILLFLRFRTDSFSSNVSQSSSQMLRIFGIENFHVVFLTALLRYIDVRETSSLCSPVRPPHSQGSEHVYTLPPRCLYPLLPHLRRPQGSGPCDSLALRRLGADSSVHALVQLPSLSKIILRNISVACTSFTF